MAGAKTRFGFQGGSDPPGGDEPQSARTVYGHDIHLQLPAGFTAPRPPGHHAPVSPAPPARPTALAGPAVVPVAAVNAGSTERCLRPNESRLARFLGRWTRSGRFLSPSRIGLETDEPLDLPRDTTLRNVLLVLLAALLAFGVTFAAVTLRARWSAAPPAAPVPAQAPATGSAR